MNCGEWWRMSSVVISTDWMICLNQWPSWQCIPNYWGDLKQFHLRKYSRNCMTPNCPLSFCNLGIVGSIEWHNHQWWEALWWRIIEWWANSLDDRILMAVCCIEQNSSGIFIFLSMTYKIAALRPGPCEATSGCKKMIGVSICSRQSLHSSIFGFFLNTVIACPVCWRHFQHGSWMYNSLIHH